ncbi:hypothetical protein RFI_34186, partial [Reticulomyxa filosa]
QFVVYRNYNAPEDLLLQCSPWESKPENLRNFMDKIRSEYGLGNGAIEVGLAHVNREIEKGEVSQVILIGDAPVNTREDVQSKRKSKEAYWEKTLLFSKPTYYEDELNRLKKHDVPVHAFFIGTFAKQGMQEVQMEMILWKHTETNSRSHLLDTFIFWIISFVHLCEHKM